MTFAALLLATVFFPRAQFHYGLERNDYLHRWYDRPLYQDSSFAEADDPAHFLNERSWRETVKALRLGKCGGIGTFIDQARRDDVIPRSALPGAETVFLAEFDSVHSGEDPVEHIVRTAEKAIASPNAFRLDGRVVMTEYGAKTSTEADLDVYVRAREALERKFGKDRFYILPYAPIVPKLNDYGQPIPESVFKEAEERIRMMLRKADGFVWDGRESIRNRRFVGKTRDEVWTPLVKRIFAEPEFRGKKLGMQMRPGHENSYLIGYSIDSAGTQTLRGYLESATRMGAEVVVGAEWDEENENTFFAPTVANGHSTQRILAYYADRWAGREPTVFPGDDTAIPNLIVSYRRSLMAGEPLELEVANVPDGSFAGVEFEIAAEWRNAAGEAVERFKAKRLSAGTCDAVWFAVPVSKLVANRTLTPVIAVRWKAEDGRENRAAFSDGFWPVDLNATRTIDFKWVKQPLREIARGISCTLDPSREPDGSVRLKASVRSPVPLRSVEILEGVDTVRMAGDDVPANDRVTIRFAIQGHVCTRTLPGLNGFVRFAGAPGVRLSPPYSPKGGIAVDGAGFVFRNYQCSNWDSILFADLPRSEAEGAVVEYELGTGLKGCVRVKDVVEKEVVGAAGEGGIALSFMRYDKVRFQPRVWGRNDADFDFTFRPGDRSPVVRLQVIDKDYRIWRSKPLELAGATGSERTFHVYERDSGAVSEVRLPESRMDDVAYDFADAARGGVLWGGVRDLSGHLGGSVAMVCGYGNGASLYGNLLTRQVTVKTPEWTKSVPMRETDGSVLFRGAAFACLPWSIVPPYAGFVIDLEIRPDAFGETRTVLAGGNANFSFVINADGTPEAVFQLGNLIDRGLSMNRNVRGPKLKEGEWNRIRLSFDQSCATVEVNGEKGSPVVFSGYEYYPSTFIMGSRERNPLFFQGGIRKLAIRAH